MFAGGQLSQTSGGEDGPEHLFFNDMEELHPWRLPQDCISGCLALPTSIELVLKNVAAARERSFSTMYKVKPDRSSTGRHNSNLNSLNAFSNTDTSITESPGYETWIHTGTKGTSGTLTSSGVGFGVGASGNGFGGTVVMKSKRSQMRAAEKSTGGTLLDLARSSVDVASRLSPLRESSLRRGASPGSPEVVRTSVNADLLRLSSGSSTQGAGSGIPSPLAATTAFGGAQGNKGRGQFHSITASQSYPGWGTPAQVREVASMGPAATCHDSVLVEDGDGPLASTSSPLQSPEGRSRSRNPSDRRSTSSPPPVVPEIPRFAEFMSEKEKLLQVLESQDRESGKPPRAATRNKSAAIHSDNDDQSDGAMDVVNRQATADLSAPRSGRSSPSPPHTAPGAAGQATARPSMSMPQAHGSPTPPLRPPSLSATPSTSSSEMEADQASGGNFGENGHYACVPGDTLNNRYTLIHELGLGRSSRVWLAVDLEQCSSSRRQLIKSYGEEKIRRLFNPKEKPMFAAIKVFRCGVEYTNCASYESRVMEYIKDGVKHPGSVAGGRMRQSFLDASTNSAEPVFGTTMTDDTGLYGLSSGRGATSGRSSQRLSGRSTTAATSPGGAPMAHRRFASLGSTTGGSFWGGLAGSTRTAPGASPSSYANHLALMRDHFTVEGAYGTHQCIVMDVVGSGVDAAINETRLQGLPLDVVRSILVTSLRGLAVLDALHIVHTDIKPENLLFIDLQDKTADEMDDFQRSRLEVSGATQLWNSSTHRRMSVAKYAAAAAAPSHHTPEPLSKAGPPETEDEETPNRSNSHLDRVLSFESSMLHSTPAEEHFRRPSLSLSNPSQAPLPPPPPPPSAQQQQQQQQQAPAEMGWVPVSPPPSLAPRILYEVRVSDYGLSFIVPPALRDGIDTMKTISQACVEAQQQRRLHPREKPGNGVTSPTEPTRATGKESEEKTELGSLAQTTSGLTMRSGRRSRARGGRLTSGSATRNDAESDAPASVDEANEEGDCVLDLDPIEQFKAMRRHRQRLHEQTLRRVEEEEAAGRHSRVQSCSARGPTNADLLTRALDSQNVDDDENYHHRHSMAAQLRSDVTQPYVNSGRLHQRSATIGGRRYSTGTESDQDPLTPLRPGGERGYLESPRRSVSMDLGNSPNLARTARLNAHMSAMITQAEHPPSGVELSILRDQHYKRGITIQSREYRAPEAILGMYFLPSCDVWSLGCVAYELVTGHFLFDISEEYEVAMQRRVEQRREQRRRRCRHDVYRTPSSEEDLEDHHEFRDRYGGRGRYSSGEDSGEDEFDPEEEELLHAPLYFEDEYERDLDTIHLKAMMRLLGPPPLALLNRTPCGVYTDLFFDNAGEFMFLEAYNVTENEEDELGFTAIQRFRDAELRAAGLGKYYAPPGTRLDTTGNYHLGSPLEDGFVHATTPDMLNHTTGNAIVYHYSDDDDDTFEQELAKTTGGGAVVRHVHTSSAAALPTNTAAASVTQTPEKDKGDTVAARQPSLQELRSHSLVDTDATASPAATLLDPPSDPVRHLVPTRIFFGDVAGSRSSSPGKAFGAGETASTLPGVRSASASGTVQVDGREVTDSTNYPIVTQGWKQLQRVIREHLDTEEEAQSFEAFLLSCLQWDPAKRAKAAALLQSPWLTQYGPLATTSSLRETALASTTAASRTTK